MLDHRKLLPSSFLVEINYISSRLTWPNYRRAKISCMWTWRIYMRHYCIAKTIWNCSWVHQRNRFFRTWSEKTFSFLILLESLREIYSPSLCCVSWWDRRGWIREKSWLIIVRRFSKYWSQPFFSYRLFRDMKLIFS